MKVRNEYIIALLVVVAVYVAAVAYQLATLEYRVGQMEHYLAHKGYRGAD
ncbi:MAG: hypothetical protein JW919_00095 [Candidatus Omnitrophica bacterium]|nr:hypothetical protein [Candidatus Omnitrophota bacterium]